MRYYFKTIFRLFFLASCIYVVEKTIYKVSENEIIIVRSISNSVETLVKKPGIHFIYQALIPGKVKINFLNLKNRNVKVGIKKELSGGLLPEMGDDGHLVLSYSVNYSIHPDKAEELYAESEFNEEKIGDIISEIVHSKFSDRFAIIFRNPADINQLTQRIKDYSEKEILGELTSDKIARKGILIQEVRLSKINVPNPQVFLRLINGTDLVLRAKIERSAASIRGEGFAIEQTKKDEAYFNKLGRTAEFLKKYPDLKEFAALDRLTDKVQVFVLPSEKYMTDALKDKLKPKSTPKVVE
ncbi:MAG: hypothetical protein K8R21_09900 [Leptospira sp.]|nr:hypothetical protein [Leptospira sp.]